MAPPEVVPEPERRIGVERRAPVERRAGLDIDESMGQRLIEALGHERVEDLLDFLESPSDGAYLLVRDEGGLLSERSISERPVGRRRPV